ncbi:MAG: hypothetical protein ACI835_005456, partial [Planctomycetota bacterium]
DVDWEHCNDAETCPRPGLLLGLTSISWMINVGSAVDVPLQVTLPSANAAALVGDEGLQKRNAISTDLHESPSQKAAQLEVDEAVRELLDARPVGVRGRILTSASRPVADVEVRLYEVNTRELLDWSPDLEFGVTSPMPLSSIGTRTDNEGRFSIKGESIAGMHELSSDKGGSHVSLRVIDQAITVSELTDLGDLDSY